MSMIEGRFQYFYCSRSLAGLPRPDVPTRDVTNTSGAGYKTEPHLEKRVENWCRCRARFITPAARRGQILEAEGGRHYLLLTTRHPDEDGHAFIVGLMPFSGKAFKRILQRNPGRWADHGYLPYACDEHMKLVSFPDAFSLTDWMKSQKVTAIPGGQGGRGIVPDDLLHRVLAHFSKKQDQTEAFLLNVKALEGRLKRADATAWRDYKSRVVQDCGC